MSVGYNPGPTSPPPFDPSAQDPAKIQAALAAAPPPVATPNAAPLPMPAPEAVPAPTDIAQPPAFVPPDSSAIANNIASAGQPNAADPTTPGAPNAAPAMPAPEKTPTQTDDLKKAQDEEKKAREASDKAQLDLQASQQPSVEEKNKLLQQQVEHLKASQAEQQKQRDQFDTAQLAANDQLKQTQDLIKKFKYKDYFADDSGGTNWGLKIASSLSAALGAYGAGLTHGPNYALQILNKNQDDWHQSQLDHLNQLKDEEVMQRTGIQDAGLARQKALSDLTLKDAGFDKLIASQLDAAAARQSSASFAPSLTAASAKLKLDAAEKETAAKKTAVELNLKLGDEERKRRLDEASIAEKNALAGLHGVQAAAGGFAPHHGKATGTGGGGDISTVGANAEELAKRIREGIDGKPLTDDQIIHAATELHVPLAGKAGVVTLDKVRSVAKFDADATIKDVRAGLQGEKQEAKEADKWADNNGLKPIEKSQRELESLNKQLKDNANNPLNQALAVEKAVSAARGGAASKQALSLALHHLGGSLDNADGIINGWRNGTLGDKQKQNFLDFVNGQLGAAQQEGKAKYEDFNKYIASQPADKKQALEAQRGRLFSGLHGFGGSSQGGGDAPGTVRVQNGHRFQLQGNGKWQAL